MPKTAHGCPKIFRNHPCREDVDRVSFPERAAKLNKLSRRMESEPRMVRTSRSGGSDRPTTDRGLNSRPPAGRGGLESSAAVQRASRRAIAARGAGEQSGRRGRSVTRSFEHDSDPCPAGAARSRRRLSHRLHAGPQRQARGVAGTRWCGGHAAARTGPAGGFGPGPAAESVGGWRAAAERPACGAWRDWNLDHSVVVTTRGGAASAAGTVRASHQASSHGGSTA